MLGLHQSKDPKDPRSRPELELFLQVHQSPLGLRGLLLCCRVAPIFCEYSSTILYSRASTDFWSADYMAIILIVVTGGYEWLRLVTGGYEVVTGGYQWLWVVLGW